MIEIKNLDKYYSKGRLNQVHAINNVSLTLPDSGMVAIFGKSGCGKTTLLNVIGGLDRAQSGSVELDGETVSTNSDECRNIDIGYIFQNYNLQKNLTVYENVALSLKLCGVTDEAYIEKRVMAALKSVDMEKYRKRLPDALSGGQQQRIAIARAIVKNPKLILADEPTGNLDEHNTVMVMNLLKEISKTRLILLVTHEADLVDLYCDKVIEIVDGKPVSSRDNEVTNGYVGKSANDVYLGDMPKRTLEDGKMRVEYFGDEDKMPSKINIISHGGVLYIQADEGLRLKFTDKSSEIKIHEGTYKPAEQAGKKVELSPVLAEPLPHGKTGHMYNFRGAVKSGFRSSFGKARKGKKLLVWGLLIFSAIIVFMVSAFGNIFQYKREIHRQYNPNIVYVKKEASGEADYISSLIGSGKAENGWVEPTIYEYPIQINTMFGFNIGNFETFQSKDDMFFYSSACMLPAKNMKNQKLLCGRREISKDSEIVITSEFADMLMSQCRVHYVDGYDDLLYMSGDTDMSIVMGNGFGNQKCRYTIVGVIESKNAEIYVSDYTYFAEKSIHKNYLTSDNRIASDLEPLEKGYIYMSSERAQMYGKKAGDKVKIQGKDYIIKGFYDINSDDGNNISFEEFVKNNYDGVYVLESIDVYCKYVYGYNMQEIENMSQSEYNTFIDQTGYDPDYIVMEYDDVYNSLNDKYYSIYPPVYNSSNFHIAMSTDDLLDIMYRIGDSDNCVEADNVYSYWNSFALYSQNPDELYTELVSKYGEDNVIGEEYLYEYFKTDYTDIITLYIVMLIVTVAIMSLCLYFIMRSALMGDIREVGICRAIGVSRKNLTYRYFIETMVLFVLTIFVGYILSSLFVSGIVSMMGSGLYYPAWLAGLTLIGLLIISVLCGLIPIRSLLRKTPAEILAKYDI